MWREEIVTDALGRMKRIMVQSLLCPMTIDKANAVDACVQATVDREMRGASLNARQPELHAWSRDRSAETSWCWCGYSSCLSRSESCC